MWLHCQASSILFLVPLHCKMRINLNIAFSANWGWATNSSMQHMTARRAREDGKWSHRAQGVLPRECCSWPSYLQTSMDSCGRRKTTRRYQREMPKIQGQLQLESVALLSAVYRELVCWLQVQQTHDSRSTFTTILMLATCLHVYRSLVPAHAKNGGVPGTHCLRLRLISPRCGESGLYFWFFRVMWRQSSDSI